MRTEEVFATDVLVIGAGPAGSSAARVAAQAGCRVLLVEARARVGEPMQCAEFLPAVAAGHVQRETVAQSTGQLVTSLPSGRLSYLDAPGRMIHRARFDAALAEAAVAAGAQLQTGTRCVTLDAMTRTVQVRSRRDAGAAPHDRDLRSLRTPRGNPTGNARPVDDGHITPDHRSLRYRVLIAADGPGSSVARLLGLAPLASIDTRQYRVSLKKPLQDTRVWLSRDFPGGYGWLFPKGGEANLGIGVARDRGVDLKVALDEFHAALQAAGLVAGTVLSRTGGRIPVSGLRRPPVQGRVLFAGDAAGLAHPVTGAGIAPALQSGELAGEAAVRFLRGDAGALDDYGEELDACFGDSLRRACARRAEMLRAWQAGRFDDHAGRRGWVVFPDYFAA